jgi:c-di-GMP phosphodiesterase
MLNDPQVGDVAVARQPIFDPGWDVIAYELLWRPMPEATDAVPAESKTATMVAAAFSELGLDALVGDKPAHVNVTREFLLSARPLPLPPRRLVLELVDAPRVDRALVEVLTEAVEGGFTLALDDYRYAPELEPLLELATIVKLDVQALGRAELAGEIRRVERRELTLVAEKIERAEEYALVRELGFHAYQGYFFGLPELSRAPATPTCELQTLCALAGTNPMTTFEELEEIMRRDAGLSDRLLRYANSAHISPRSPISSVRQALTMIGTAAVRRWALLLAFAGLRRAPDHVLGTAMLRARMAELLAPSMAAATDRAFTVGLFSLLDALTGRPMRELVGELRFDERLTGALVRHEGPEGDVLNATLAYERGAFDDAAEHVRPELLADAYRRALLWSDVLVPAVA